MSNGTIRIAPLGAFECTVDEFRHLVGDSKQPEHVPFPHDEQEGILTLCAGDGLRYGPVLFHDGITMRVVTLTVEGDDQERCCIAVYGRREGPRRRLADGSWSVRVRPYQDGEEYVAARLVQAMIRTGNLTTTKDVGRCPVMVIVRHEDDEDFWVNCRPVTFVTLPEDW